MVKGSLWESFSGYQEWFFVTLNPAVLLFFLDISPALTKPVI